MLPIDVINTLKLYRFPTKKDNKIIRKFCCFLFNISLMSMFACLKVKKILNVRLKKAALFFRIVYKCTGRINSKNVA